MAASGSYDNRPPFPTGFRPYSRSKTTYSGMCDWVRPDGTRIPQNVPSTLTDTNYRELSGANPQSSIPRAVMPSDKRSDEFYRRYEQLSNNIKMRYPPNPPAPRERQGRIGGSWRHIKEVLGHSGSRVVFVDGLVRLYDYEKKRGGSLDFAPGMASRMGRQTPLYGVNRYDMGQDRIVQHEYERAAPAMPLSARPGSNSSKYKGFYALKRENTYY